MCLCMCLFIEFFVIYILDGYLEVEFLDLKDKYMGNFSAYGQISLYNETVPLSVPISNL